MLYLIKVKRISEVVIQHPHHLLVAYLLLAEDLIPGLVPIKPHDLLFVLSPGTDYVHTLPAGDKGPANDFYRV